MEIRTHRLTALKKLVDQAGSIASFARMHSSIDPTYVSQLLNGHRSFGERAARNMEEKLGLPSGWLDRSNELTTKPSISLKPESSSGSVKWPFGDFSRYESLSPTKKAQLAQIVEAFLAGAQEDKSDGKKTA